MLRAIDSGEFAAWAGIAPEQAQSMWRRLEPDLVPVELEKRVAWLHPSDVRAFTSPAIAGGVRLLPPHDPYLEQPDRTTLLPDTDLRQRVWRATGSRGVVTLNGRLVGTWRGRLRARRLEVTVEPFARLSTSARRDVESAAHLLAVFRGARVAEVAFAPRG